MKKILSIFLMGALLFACKEPKGSDVFKTSEALPIGLTLKLGKFVDDEVVLDKENYTLWVELLEASGMYDVLNLNGSYTAFAPNNAAMQAFLVAQGAATPTEFVARDKDYAQEMVKFHTLGTKLENTELSDGVDGYIPTTTTSDVYLKIAYGDQGINSIYIDDALIVMANTQATNGVIHTIDKVMTPVTGTIWEQLSSDPDFSIYAAVIEAVGMDSYYDAITAPYTETGGETIELKQDKMVFAVPNSVYNREGINSLQDLLSYLGGTSETAFKTFVQYLSYHNDPKLAKYRDIINFDESIYGGMKNKLYPMDLGLINVRDIGGQIYLNYDPVAQEGVKFISTDVRTKNGFMQVIDGVLPLKDPAPTTQIFEFTDYAEVGALVGEVYRMTSYAEDFSGTFSVSTTKCYSWPNVSGNSVGYRYFGSVSRAPGRKALYSDFLVFNLRQGNRLSMTTTQLAKGKYNVYLAHNNIGETNSQANGYISIWFNYVQVGMVATRGESSKDMYIPDRFVGEIVLDETTTYKLDILTLDDKQHWLDYLRFEPVIE